jgi:phosphoglycerate dehydrogenase-like enzyme
MVAVRRRPEAGGIKGVEVLGGTEALPDLLSQSDFVVLALPLTSGTTALIDDQALSQMKPGSWLINVSRGALVDEAALVRALRLGPIGGAVLDAFREEPLGEASPFYRLSNCIVTPHTSWSSDAVLGRTFDVFCENLRRFRAGEPLDFVVDPDAGY